MRTDEESEIDCSVANRVASVTIESDSQPSNSVAASRVRRRKKRIARQAAKEKMEVDVCVKSLTDEPSSSAVNGI